MILGGVPIDYDWGPEGHSDADVLLHALTDAVLGAAGLGDIGEWFPCTDKQWKNADSTLFLSEAVKEVRQRGWQIGNADCTIFAEAPRLGDVRGRIRARLAELLNVDIDAVNVKAKTGERVGPIGRGEAIAADAIVLLVPGTQ